MRLVDLINNCIDVEDAYEDHLPEIYDLAFNYIQEVLPLLYYSFREEELQDEIYMEIDEIYIDEAPTFATYTTFHAECSKRIEYLFALHYPEKII